MGFGNLALFATSGGFGDCGGFGAACGFDTLGCCGASGFFGFAGGAAHGRVGILSLMGSGGFGCVTCCGVRSSSSNFCFCFGEKCLLAHLLGGAMSELRA